MYNLTKCALCGNETELELSHTVPKMAVRTLKKTAIGNIRSTENPNKTIQDSEKLYMLCGDCEDLFSEKETWLRKLRKQLGSEDLKKETAPKIHQSIRTDMPCPVK